MSENSTSGNESKSEPLDPVDAALAHLETLIRGMEDERSKADELAKVPEDIPRFVTRVAP